MLRSRKVELLYKRRVSSRSFSIKIQVKMLRAVFIMCTLSLLIMTTYCAEYPKNITKCKYSDLNINECVKEQANKIIAGINHGDYILGNTYKNSVKLPDISLGLNNTLVIYLENCTGTINIDKLKITELKINNKLPIFEMIMGTENNTDPMWSSRWECTYDANGKLHNYKYNNKGFISITFLSSKFNYSAKFESGIFHYDNNINYLQFNLEKIDAKLTDSNDEIQAHKLTNIFNNEPDFNAEVTPITELLASRMVTHIVKLVFNLMSSDEK